MIKYSANSFLAMKIGFANEIANICERVGADVNEVMTGIGMDSRIGSIPARRIWVGAAVVSGKISSPAAHRQRSMDTLRNCCMPHSISITSSGVVIQKLQEKLRILKGRTIGLLGLAFKPETDDLRDAPSLGIAEIAPA